MEQHELDELNKLAVACMDIEDCEKEIRICEAITKALQEIRRNLVQIELKNAFVRTLTKELGRLKQRRQHVDVAVVLPSVNTQSQDVRTHSFSYEEQPSTPSRPPTRRSAPVRTARTPTPATTPFR